MAFFIKIGFPECAWHSAINSQRIPENLSGFRVNLENTGSLSSERVVQHSKLLFFIGLPLAYKNFRKSGIRGKSQSRTHLTYGNPARAHFPFIIPEHRWPRAIKTLCSENPESGENPGQGYISPTGIRQEPIFHLLFMNIVDQEP